MDLDTISKINLILEKMNALEEVREDVAKIKSDISNFTGTLSETNKKISELEAIISVQQVAIGKLEKATKSKNLIITGLEENENNSEDLLKVVLNLFSSSLRVNLTEGDVDTIFRLGKKNDKIRPIMLSFISKKVRDTILLKRSLLKGTKVYINEHMTTLERENHNDLLNQRRKAIAEGKSAEIIKNRL